MTKPLKKADALRLVELLKKRQKIINENLIGEMYPDHDMVNRVTGSDILNGPVVHAREKYPAHLDFFKAGAKYRERCAMAANRVGKTAGMGAYETATHLTGEYPEWWEGRRFETLVSAWAAGKTNETTRDIVQKALIGDVIERENGTRTVTGTGLIPRRKIGRITWKSGVPNLIDTVKVKHKSGWNSLLGFKAYHQGRGGFEGTAKHVIWLDEEPPLDVYGECIIRTATTDGLIMLTFTPLDGISKTVQQFLPKPDA